MDRQLLLFEGRVRSYPYSTDDFARGLYRHPKVHALAMRYLEHNSLVKFWMVFDVDRPYAAWDWQYIDEDRVTPAPNFAVVNPETGHAHLFYGLEWGVCVSDPVKYRKPIHYFAAVEGALRRRLQADKSYGGLISQNPLHPDWPVIEWCPYLYDLDELADYLDLETDRRKRLPDPDYGLARNDTLFNRVRRWSYSAVRRYWHGDYEPFADAVLVHTATTNTFFPKPLDHSEFKHIAKSVSKWVWVKFTPERFSEIQRQRSKLGNAVKTAKAGEKRALLVGLLRKHPDASDSELARLSGIPRRTVGRLLEHERGGHSPYQYIEPDGDSEISKMDGSRP